MKEIEIKVWANISEDGWESLLLGNGASIAIHPGFSYETLHGVAEAQDLLSNASKLFAKLGTTDFEHVLLACWYAEHVNIGLGTPSAIISNAYQEVRSALIESVRTVHPVHSDVSTDIKRIGVFASNFSTVVSLNYDLTLYWAMLVFNKENGSWFKDAFHHGEFQTDWEYLRSPLPPAAGVTLVYYPHGSLALARNYFGNEEKISVGPGTASDLLETINLKWSSGNYIPVFVSEGISKQKVAAIRRSHYLTNIFEKVLPEVGVSLVVYGWSFHERDQHILEAIKANPPERLAVSVFMNQPHTDQQRFCHHVLGLASQYFPDTSVTFFDSASPGCWNNQ